MIRREIEEVSPLKIAVIGYNREQALTALERIAERLDEEGKLRKFSPPMSLVLETNGNYYKAVNGLSAGMLKGFIFDQLLIADDSRWNTLQVKADLIVQVVDRIDDNIPENYKVQFLEV